MREAQLFRLFEFADTVWQPIVHRISSAASSPEEGLVLRLIEAICWLQLGLDLGCFPSDEVHMLLNQQRSSLQSSFQKYEPFLSTTIPPALYYSLKETIGSTGRLGTLHDFTEPSQLASYLDSATALSSDMDADELISTFCGLLASTESLERSGMTDFVSSDMVAELYAEGSAGPESATSAEALIAGFIKLLGKLLQWNRFFETLASDRYVDTGDRSALGRRIGQITYWRLNLNNRTIKAQFEAAAVIAAPFAQNVMHEALLGGSTVNADFFVDAASGLGEDWLRYHPYQLYKSAAG